MKTACTTTSLRAAIAGILPADEEAALHRHLEVCATCAEALDQLAGGESWSKEVAALLPKREGDADLPAHDDWSEADFIVDHLEPAEEPGVLGRLGSYDVLETLGRGGMGVVLKAYDRELKRCVAIKVLSPHLAHSSLARQRFTREAQAAAAVVHPNVLAIHHVQAGGRLPYFVMALVAGESLAERLKAQGTLELKEILRIGVQVAAGLAAAHDQGLVHRDVKPANILLEKGVERAVLTDFGLARAADDLALTRQGVIAGTPPYLAPEQARGEPLDGRADLFSLGCVLYEMASGVSPFRADSVVATVRRIVEEEPQSLSALNPELPPWFVAIVHRLLAKDPGQRFASAREVSALLENCLAHLQQPAHVPLPATLVAATPRRKSKSILRRPGVIAMVGTVGCFILGIVMWQMANDPEQRVSPSQQNNSAARNANESKPKAGIAMPKLLRQFSTNDDGVKTLAVSADGKLIAVANGNPTVTMMAAGRAISVGDWKPKVSVIDAASGTELIALQLTNKDEDALLVETKRVPTFEVTALALSPVGNVLAVGTSIGQVKLFDTKTGELLRSLDDKQAKMADKKTPEALLAITRAMACVTDLAFSCDGALLAMSGEAIGRESLVFDGIERLGRAVTGPGRLKVWDVSTGALKHDLVGHSHAEAVAFSPDCALLASAGRWDGGHEHGTGVIVWNAATGERVRTFPVESNGGAHAVVFSPNSKMLVIAARHFDKENDTSSVSLSLCYVASGILDWKHVIPGWAKPVGFASDGKNLVVFCNSSGRRSRNTLRFVNRQTGAVDLELREEEFAQSTRWHDCVIASNGLTLVVGGFTAKGGDNLVDKVVKRGNVSLWSLEPR